jgi:hypothetical protein
MYAAIQLSFGIRLPAKLKNHVYNLLILFDPFFKKLGFAGGLLKMA